MREDFHGIVLLVDSGTNEINWEFGFVKGFDNTDISVDFFGRAVDDFFDQRRCRWKGQIKSQGQCLQEWKQP